MVAKSILNDHRDLEDTLKIDELKELIVSKKHIGVVHKKYGNVQRIVVVVEEIEIQ
jgi:Mg2+/Co2+ transporter CorB